jgi:hypothetical protein
LVAMMAKPLDDANSKLDDVIVLRPKLLGDVIRLIVECLLYDIVVVDGLLAYYYFPSSNQFVKSQVP